MNRLAKPYVGAGLVRMYPWACSRSARSAPRPARGEPGPGQCDSALMPGSSVHQHPFENEARRSLHSVQVEETRQGRTIRIDRLAARFRVASVLKIARVDR